MKWEEYWKAKPPKLAIPDDDMQAFLEFAKYKYYAITIQNACAEVNGKKMTFANVDRAVEHYIFNAMELLMLHREYMRYEYER